MNIKVDRPNYKTVTLRWAAVPGAKTYEIEVKDKTSSHPWTKGPYEVAKQKFTVPFLLKAGHWYQLTIRAYRSDNDFRIQKDVVTVRADFTKEELEELFYKATFFVKDDLDDYDEITWLYRNKPKAYFKDIFREKNGIMEVYEKDNNGDPASIINGQIDGLFFASHLDHKTGEPPSTSIFGDRRLYIPAATVLLDDEVRLYFADFYCIHNWHYVTIVQTTRDSEANQFCKNRLIKLNPRRNDFFFVRSNGVVKVATRAHIEIFYTEDIDIEEWEAYHNAYLEDVTSHGRTSTPGGLPKNPSCRICNLDINMSDSEDEDESSSEDSLF